MRAPPSHSKIIVNHSKLVNLRDGQVFYIDFGIFVYKSWYKKCLINGFDVLINIMYVLLNGFYVLI